MFLEWSGVRTALYPIVVGVMMKYFFPIGCAFLLSGCAGVVERAITGQTAASRLKADLVGDLTLRAALEQDMAKKNAELLYLSANGYSCGPSGPKGGGIGPVVFTKPDPKATAARAERRLNYAKITYGDLKTVLMYGESLDKAIQLQADSAKTINDFAALIKGLAGIVPQEFQFAPNILGAVVKAGGVVNSYAARADLINLARTSIDGLAKAREHIKQKGIQKLMTEQERKAFSEWDECAYDRLLFLRAYDPKHPPEYLSGVQNVILTRTMGESRSAILDFSTLYSRYLDEKSAFVSQLNDYLADVDAIIDANKKLASLDANTATPDDFIVAITGIVTDATTISESYKTIRDNTK